MLTRRLAALALGALLVTGCSGGDEPAATPSGPWAPAAEDIKELPGSGERVALIPAELVPEPATGGFVVLQDDGEADSAGQPVKDVTVLRTEGCYTVILSSDEGADAPAPLCQDTNPEDFTFWDEAYRDVLDLFGESDLDYAASSRVLPGGG